MNSDAEIMAFLYQWRREFMETMAKISETISTRLDQYNNTAEEPEMRIDTGETLGQRQEGKFVKVERLIVMKKNRKERAGGFEGQHTQKTFEEVLVKSPMLRQEELKLEIVLTGSSFFVREPPAFPDMSQDENSEQEGETAAERENESEGEEGGGERNTVSENKQAEEEGQELSSSNDTVYESPRAGCLGRIREKRDTCCKAGKGWSSLCWGRKKRLIVPTSSSSED
ncbi:Hypothetical predicted protein [Podarcis lilfordi]|uniref:Uncharacterized protein n=1 Tax=Podarcis lilfordi TaxID=74358 RepID=A0AA35PS43_9SAUR|nr:Hypothetical predicted protein [Podarcis lilfordi]